MYSSMADQKPLGKPFDLHIVDEAGQTVYLERRDDKPEGDKPEGVAPTGINAIDLRQFTDDGVVTWTADVSEELDHVKTVLGDMIAAGKSEIERRLRENGGRALAHPRAEKIELEDEYTPYGFDIPTLRAAGELLPDDERAKIIKRDPGYVTLRLPEGVDRDVLLMVQSIAKQCNGRVEVVSEKWTPGAAVSITALIRKYGEKSEVGALLSKAMTREKTGSKLVFKMRKAVA